MSRQFLTDIIGRYLGLGGATPDDNNPLSVRGPAALFDGHTNGHQIKVNKSTISQTSSILFQTGYSGRAEMGTTGNDHYTVKVSADGALWKDGFEINSATGITDFKQQPTFQGQKIYHTGDFDIQKFASLTGAKFTGPVEAPNLLRNDEDNSIAAHHFESLSGINGGYVFAKGHNHRWGGTIWSIGTEYSGTPSGNGHNLGSYCLSWVRDSHSDVISEAGEGFYARVANKTIAALGNRGSWFAGDLKVAASTIAGKLGVGGAIPDEHNRLSVNTPAVLLNNTGAGIDIKFNKASVGDDAALTFQTGFQTQALMGLLADNSYTLKVGPEYKTAMTADPTTGKVSFPHTKQKRALRIQGRWYCEPDNSWVGLSNSYGSATENFGQNAGTNATPSHNWTFYGPLVNAGDTITRLRMFCRSGSTSVTGMNVMFYFSNGGGTATRVFDKFTSKFNLTNWHHQNVPLSTPFTCPSDGFLLMYIQPVGSYTTRQYIYTSVAIDYESEF